MANINLSERRKIMGGYKQCPTHFYVLGGASMPAPFGPLEPLSREDALASYEAGNAIVVRGTSNWTTPNGGVGADWSWGFLMPGEPVWTDGYYFWDHFGSEQRAIFGGARVEVQYYQPLGFQPIWIERSHLFTDPKVKEIAEAEMPSLYLQAVRNCIRRGLLLETYPLKDLLVKFVLQKLLDHGYDPEVLKYTWPVEFVCGHVERDFTLAKMNDGSYWRDRKPGSDAYQRRVHGKKTAIYRIIIPTPLSGNEWNPSLEIILSNMKRYLSQETPLTDQELSTLFYNEGLEVVPVTAIAQIRPLLDQDHPTNGDVNAWTEWAYINKIAGVEIVEESVW